MTGHREEPADRDSDSNTIGEADASVVRPAYKVLGQLNEETGVGVLGQNDASDGTPVGVEGAVPNASGGYGLFTADNLGLEGALDTLSTDFDVVTGTVASGDTGNVVAGHASNGVASGVRGATIGGGGYDAGTPGQANRVFDDYGTVAGGRANVAGSDGISTVAEPFATVAGGFENVAGGQYATVAGGFQNDATAEASAVGGGRGNVASDRFAAVAGGLLNTATAHGTAVGGGITNEASGSYATVGGGRLNDARAAYATIAGGGPTDQTNVSSTRNRVYDEHGTVGGGGNNRAGTDDGAVGTQPYATVAGGNGNAATHRGSTVSGGEGNVAAAGGVVAGGIGNVAGGDQSTVGGGSSNNASGEESTIGGGFDNTADGIYATVPGGERNTASGRHSFAAGRNAEAAADGAFVWGDSSTEMVASTVEDEIRFQAGGGLSFYSSSDLSTGVELASGSGSWSSVSTRAVKTHVQPVDPGETLAALESLAITRWEYDSREAATHMGPMAEDFHAAFGLGANDTHITTVDAQGVAFAAIQGLAEKLDEENAAMRAALAKKADRIDRLEQRLTALETNVDSPTAAPDD